MAFQDPQIIEFRSIYNVAINQSDLPKLQSIELGIRALQGDWYKKTIEQEPYYFNTTLIMIGTIR